MDVSAAIDAYLSGTCYGRLLAQGAGALPQSTAAFNRRGKVPKGESSLTDVGHSVALIDDFTTMRKFVDVDVPLGVIYISVRTATKFHCKPSTVEAYAERYGIWT